MRSRTSRSSSSSRSPTCRWRCAASPPAGRAGWSSGWNRGKEGLPRGYGRSPSSSSALSCYSIARHERAVSRLIVNLVEWSRRHGAAMSAVMLLLAIWGGIYTADNIRIDTDIDKLINPNLPWRQQEKMLEDAFPQNVDQLAVVIDAKTPDEAEDATAALAAKLSRETAVFKSVRRPDGGKFFRQNGLLFLPVQDVQDFAA